MIEDEVNNGKEQHKKQILKQRDYKTRNKGKNRGNK